MSKESKVELINYIAELYGKLYDVMSETEAFSISDEDGKPAFTSFAGLSHFTSMKGVRYDNSAKFLLIGRAVNGWNPLDASCRQNFVNAASSKLEVQGFSWIKQNEEDPSSLYSSYGKSNEETYLLSRSPFWRTSKEICLGINETADDPKSSWVESIAWTNLYKVAPPHSGNPGAKMIKQEREICREILKSEIALYDPAYILFVTGWDWFREFWTGEPGTESFLSKSVFTNNTSNGIYAESSFKYEERKFVVSCRPERRKEQDFVKSVLDCYSKL